MAISVVRVSPAQVYSTGVIQPGLIPQMRTAGLAGFDPTQYAVSALPGMVAPSIGPMPGYAIRVLVNRGDNWRGRR